MSLQAIRFTVIFHKPAARCVHEPQQFKHYRDPRMIY